MGLWTFLVPGKVLGSRQGFQLLRSWVPEQRDLTRNTSNGCLVLLDAAFQSCPCCGRQRLPRPAGYFSKSYSHKPPGSQGSELCASASPVPRPWTPEGLRLLDCS